VPYWCESAAQYNVDAAEWWLAGSDPYERISVLPEPPGTIAAVHAGLAQWRSLAGFARTDGWVDRLTAGRYPRLPVSRSTVAPLINQRAQARSPMPAMTTDQVIAGLRRQAPALGLLVD
jgi:hypothetical protein